MQMDVPKVRVVAYTPDILLESKCLPVCRSFTAQNGCNIYNPSHVVFCVCCSNDSWYKYWFVPVML